MAFFFSQRHHSSTLAYQAQGSTCVIVGLGNCCRANQHLHRMGLVEGECVKVISTGKCMMVECGGVRIALCRKLAGSVEVIVEALKEAI